MPIDHRVSLYAYVGDWLPVGGWSLMGLVLVGSVVGRFRAADPTANEGNRVHANGKTVRDGTNPASPGGAGVLMYLGVIVVLLAFENSMVYPASPAVEHWQPAPTRQIEDVELTLADGTRVHGWWLPRPGAAGALLYLHGNAGNLSDRGDAVVEVSDHLGVPVLIIDYPGYGKSGGRPSERAATRRPTRARLADGGEAGAGGRGGHLRRVAGRGRRGGPGQPAAAPGAVVVKSFTSMPDVAQKLYPWLPVRLVMQNRYESLRGSGGAGVRCS